MSDIFTTDADAKAFIIDTLETSEGSYDVDAIYDAAFEYDAERGGIVQAVDEDGFWTIVLAHAID